MNGWARTSGLAKGESTSSSPDDLSTSKRTDLVRRYVPLREGLRILDVGCGNGAYSIKFSIFGCNVIGIDVRREALIQAKACRRPTAPGGEVQFALARAEALPFGDNLFDVVTLIEVLEHVLDEETTLREAHRVLKHGGRLVCFVPNRWWPVDSHGMRVAKWEIPFMIPFLSWAPTIVRRKVELARIYSRRRIVDLLERSGYVVGSVEYFWPAVDQLRIGPLKNERFRSTVRGLFEQLAQSGFGFMGMSIFVCAKKPLTSPFLGSNSHSHG